MPSPSQLLRSARPAFRSSRNTFFTSTSQQSKQQTSTIFRFAKRWQSSAAGTNATAGVSSVASTAVKQGFLKKMWNSPIGFKTVHFWAPVMKWCIVLAGISDFYRPPEKLSLTQNFALTCTGFIWTRWCLIIKPRNILLASVNFGLGIVGIIQVSRILMWRRTPEGQAMLALGEGSTSVKEEVKADLKGVKEDVLDVVKKA